MLEISPQAITEVDAASNSGIDDMRQITQALRYNGFGKTPNKAIILNECQGLSKQAWDSLLTSTEEPPAHVYFFFTSTNPEKIPKALLTRSTSYELRPLKHDDLMDLLDEVCGREGYKTKEAILAAVAQAAEGSARHALTMLAKVHACESVKEAQDLLLIADEHAEAIQLARDLVAGKLQWPQVTKALKALAEDGVQAESVRLMIVGYLRACLMGSDSDKRTVRLLDILECFMKPATGPEKEAPLLIAFGRYIYG
jgi:DNA polymerase III gamma/tau subunit